MDKSFIKEIEEITKKIKDFIENQAPYKKIDIAVLQKQENKLAHLTRQRWYDLINQLVKAYELANISAIESKPVKNLPQVIGTKTSKQDFPLDMVNTELWNLLQRIKPNKELTFKYQQHMRIDEGEAYALNTANNADRNAKKEVNIFFAIDFNALENDTRITKKLEPYDQRVYMAIDALFNNGCDVMSLGQIYENMGFNGVPSKRDKKKIDDSITKINSAHIFIDNKQECEAGYKYDNFKYDSNLLPMERLQAVINGNLTESAIHIFRAPPLMSFARGRHQMTTISQDVLNSPLNKTNANIAIENYLIGRIAHIKKGNSNKILLSTLYERAGITTSKQKQRAPEKIQKLLEHYKKVAYIKAYKEDAENITIIV